MSIGSGNGLAPVRHEEPLPEPMLIYIINWNLRNKHQWNSNQITTFHSWKCILKMLSAKWRPFFKTKYVCVTDVWIHFHDTGKRCIPQKSPPPPPPPPPDNGLWLGAEYATSHYLMGYCQLDPWETNSSEIFMKMQNFSFTVCIWKCRQLNGGHFVQGRWVQLR